MREPIHIGAGEVTRQVDQRPIVTVARAVDPDRAGPAAAVTFPARRIARVSADDHAGAARLP